MGTILYKRKVDLSKKDQSFTIVEYLTLHEMEVEIESGPSMLSKSVILIFTGNLPEQVYYWPFDLTEVTVKRIIDFEYGDNSWPIRKVEVISEPKHNAVVYLSILTNKANFI